MPSKDSKSSISKTEKLIEADKTIKLLNIQLNNNKKTYKKINQNFLHAQSENIKMKDKFEKEKSKLKSVIKENEEKIECLTKELKNLNVEL